MSGQGAEKLNRGEAAEFQEIIDRDPEKRIRTLSRKALENAIGENTWRDKRSLEDVD